MDAVEHYRRLFAYDRWANRETLTSLKASGGLPASALGRMAHVLGAGRLWLSRVEGREKPLPVWPTLALPDCEREAERLADAWRERLAGLSEAALSRRVSYVNSKGEPWESSEGDILMHTVMHASYHRGQIASDLRAAGFAPAYTDLIHAVRQGFLK